MDFSAWVALGCFVGMLSLITLGVPVFICLTLAGGVGSILVGGLDYTLQQFSTSTYYVTSQYSFAVVPLFILMGVLAGDSGIASKAYDALSKWVGHLRGGLLIATTGASAFFGACSGIELASAAVFSKIALPELEKANYDRSVSMGVIAGSAALSVLIPPSIPIIIFCILADVSIGKSLVGGIVPGIVLALLYVAGISVIGIFKPRAVPRISARISWRERIAAVTEIMPLVMLFVLVIGGMLIGAFPATVGGAIGAVGILIWALFTRTGVRTLLNSFFETIIVNAQIYPLVIGGYIFARFIALSGLPTTLAEVIASVGLSRVSLMLAIVLFYLFVGCVLEFISMLIITIPIVFPLMISAGYDPVACVIIIVVLSSIATITPPIGMACFVIASVAKVRPEEVFRGILPFFLIDFALLAMVMIFPELVTWLPDLFYSKMPV